MGSRRNRNEIIYDILDALAQNNGQLKPTRLLYKANMSHSQMKEYIGELSEKSLLELVEDKSKQYYRLTNTGYEFFHNLRKIREMSDALGL